MLGAGALWVGAGDRRVRVDARTGRVAGSVGVEVQAAASDGLRSCTAGREGGPGRLVGAFTLARNTEGLLAAGHGSLWLATFGGGELLRLDPSRR